MMNKHLEKFLPLEFKSGNEIPVTSVLMSQDKMLRIIQEVADSIGEVYITTMSIGGYRAFMYYCHSSGVFYGRIKTNNGLHLFESDTFGNLVKEFRKTVELIKEEEYNQE